MNRYLRQIRCIYHTLLLIALLWSAQSTHLLCSTMSAAHAQVQPQGSLISGHVPPLLQKAKPMGKPAATMLLSHLEVFLPLRNQQQMDGFLNTLENLAAPQYHRYLSPAIFLAEFAPAQSTIEHVSAYLQEQGFHITSVAPNHLYINASATVATVEKAFALQINYYQIRGERVYAPATDPVVAKTVAGDIQCIVGLDNVANVYRSHAMTLHEPHPAFQGYTPTDLRTAYDVSPLIARGAIGNGQMIALVEPNSYSASDINAYRQRYQLSPGIYSAVPVDGASTAPGPHTQEVEADMEIISALAPGASLKVYIGPMSTPGFIDTLNQTVVNASERIVDSSWNDCEPAFGTSILSGLSAIFKEGQLQGQTIYANSGDAGAYGCGDTDLNVTAPADMPYVMSIGGTSLHTIHPGTDQSETAWSNPTPTPGVNVHDSGSGGGFSAYFLRPAYQQGPYLTNIHRQVPDLAFNADPATGDLTYCSISSAGCSGWQIMGGTRLAVALCIGLAATVIQYLQDHHATILGKGDRDIYLLYTIPQPYPAFRDVTTGTNLYYHAIPGYDLATGLGPYDAWNIARDQEVNTPLVILCRAADLSSTAHVAVLCRSASTNTAALVMRVNTDGSANLLTLPGGGLPNTETSLPKGSTQLAALLKHIGDVSTIPEHYCYKSASFGTFTTMTYHGETSSDLSCLTTQDPPDNYALWLTVDSILHPYVQLS